MQYVSSETNVMLTAAGKSLATRTSKDAKSRLSLMDKWRNHYHGRGQDENTQRFTNKTITWYFWLVILTELYCMLGYVIPFSCSDFEDTSIYYLKVLTCFVFINTVANWACVKFYRTSLEHTDDRPDIKKTLWDDHPDADVTQNGDHRNEQTDPLLWKRCDTCLLTTPPRCHHCKVCNKCILKRDHHCYMTGVCVGFHNQRYFVVLNFYTAIASLVGLPLIWSYMYHNFLPITTSSSDFFLPVTIYRSLIGTYHIRYAFMVCHVYTLWWSGITALAFFVWQMYVISRGKTSQEVAKAMRIRCTSKMAANFRDVFGDFWGFNFVFPAQILFRQRGDGMTWDNLKRC